MFNDGIDEKMFAGCLVKSSQAHTFVHEIRQRVGGVVERGGLENR